MTDVSANTNVLHLVPSLFGDRNGIIGGAERYALELARHMAKVRPTRLISFGEKSHDEWMDRLHVRVLGKPWHVRGQQSNPLHPALLRELRWAKIVHCHQQHILASSIAAVFCRINRRRVFVSDLGGGGWDISGYISTDRWYHGHLHISEYSRRVFGHEGKRWAHVILGGVDTRKFSPDPSVQCNGTALFVGRLLPHKGILDLVEAIPESMTLELIGKPYDEDFLRELHEAATGKRVRFRHDCDDKDLVRAYRKSLCIVLPSVYRTHRGEHTAIPELLGQTLLEGMSCSIPGVGTNVASLPEVVEDGVSGFLVPPNDVNALRNKLLWLRDHREKSREMGKVARQRVLEKFSWDHVVARCLRLYTATKMA